MGPKMYVLVRKDLSRSQQTVQASHAVAQYLLSFPGSPKKLGWDNGIMVVLAAEDEADLKTWFHMIYMDGIDVQYFEDQFPSKAQPEWTAICAIDRDSELELMFHKLVLI